MTDKPHSYDNDPIVQKMVAEAFNSGLDAVTLALAMSVGDSPPPYPPVTMEELGALIERLHKLVPSVPDSAVS